jgi:uncharacterized membrane protein
MFYNKGRNMKNFIGKSVFFFTILITSFLLSLLIPFHNSFSQEVYKNTEGHFEMIIPVDWKEIPESEIEINLKKVQKKAGKIQDINYAAGFQKRLSREWFSYPYFLISVVKSGKLSESEISSMAKEFNSVLKNFDSLDNTKLKNLINDIKKNESYYDKENSRLIYAIEITANGTKMSGLFISKFTSYGILNLFFYSSYNSWEKYYPEFVEIADNVKIDSAFSYEISEIQKKDVKLNSESDVVKINEDEKNFSAKYDILFPLLNFLFFTIPFIIILLLIKNSNIGKEKFQFAGKYCYISSVTVCFIFAIIQIYIANSIIFPIILNLLLIYPLSKFFIYFNNSSILNEDDVSPIQNRIEEVEKSGPSVLLEENNPVSKTEVTLANESVETLSAEEKPIEEEMETLNDECFVCVCPNCKNDIEVDETEIQNKKYICPECNSENQIEIKQIELLNKINEGPVGIEGWLVLPSIGIVAGFLVNIGEIVQYMNLDQDSIPKSLIDFGLFKNTALAIMIFVLGFFFYKKKKQTPSLFIGYLIISSLLTIIEVNQIDSALSSMKSLSKNNSLGTEVVRDIAGTIFWSMYFLISKRVKNTFVK